MFKNIFFKIHLQPIISSITKRIQGVEALVRTKNSQGNEITPGQLFAAVEKKGKILELNKHLIELSINKFQDYQDNIPLLFINLESEFVIDDYNHKQDFYLFELCNKFDIDPSSIVLEIKENSIENNDLLYSFCQKHKAVGFQIALDDFGTGNSTYERLNIVSPDIVKIDKCLFENISDNFINQKIIKSIADISNNIGASLLAEGVEEVEEIIFSLSVGIRLYQGWYFDKDFEHIEKFNYADKFKKPMKDLRNITQKKLFARNKIINSLDNFTIPLLKKNLIVDFESILREHCNSFNVNILEAYIIEQENTLQVTDTFYADNKIKIKNLNNTDKGYDHIFSDIFTIINTSVIDVHLTEMKMSKLYDCNVYEFYKGTKIGDKKVIIYLKIREEDN
jgi:EAL domain-containing protein (putative c-di-GMP-specific phosphodiesterase class I)